MAKSRDRFYILAWVWKDRIREYIPERMAEYDTFDEANSHYHQLTPNADDMGQIELWCCRVTKNGFEKDAERISMKDTYKCPYTENGDCQISPEDNAPCSGGEIEQQECAYRGR